jgi:DNA-binding MarR family transcriptional regulator
MPVADRTKIINDFLGSLHVFYSAINELIEEQLREDLGGELTIAQLKLLKLVASANIESISDAAAFCRVSNAAASKSVDRLVRRGLIRRIESANDRRVTHLSTTEAGNTLLARYETAQNQVLDGLFRQFMPSDFVETTKLLDRLSADLVEMDASPQELCFRCGIYFRDSCLLREVVKRTCYYYLHRTDREGQSTPTAPRDEDQTRNQ